MITGIAGLLLYLWVLFGIAVIAISFLVGGVQTYWLSIIQRFSLPVRCILLWSLVLFPYVAGLYIAALTLVPSLEHMAGFSLDHCHQHGGSHGHLCWAHPPVFVFASWQGISAAVFALLLIGSVGKTFYRGHRHHRHSQLLTSLAESHKGIHQLESDIPSAFTLGFFRPQILISRALTEQLSSAEMAVVQRHEFAHQAKRDPLRLWLFGGLLGVFVPRVAKRFYKAMELTLEQIADATVANEIKDPLFIAETLVKVNRLTTRFFSMHPSYGACHFGGAPLEQRIHQLLNGTQQRRFPLAKMLIIISLAIMLSLGGVDATHHLIEDFLHSPTVSFSH